MVILTILVFVRLLSSLMETLLNVTYDLGYGWNLIVMPGENADTTEIDSAFWSWTGSFYEIIETPTVGKAVWVYSTVRLQAVVTAEKIES